MPNYTLREFHEEDREPLIEIDNRDLPEHWRWTPAEWADMDRLRATDTVFLRRVVGHPETDAPIAYLDMTDRGTTPRRLEGVIDTEIRVAHDWRRQGIGTLLYAEALKFAQERGAKRMTAWFQELDPGMVFAAKFGFAIQDRTQPSSLDLTQFDFSRFPDAERKALDNGVTIFRWADVPDTDENRRKYYALVMPIQRDMPTNDSQPSLDPSFEEWEKKRFTRTDFVPETHVLAEKDGVWIGMSQLGFHPDKPTIGHTWATGTLKEYRGQGIATALKLRAFQEAKARGCTVITTGNHKDNAPMLAINHKLGFVPDRAWVSYNKGL